MVSFKDTLNILKTDFEMKGNLPIKEISIQEKWLANDIYQQILNKNHGNVQKTLHDGPPYANGSIHVGHAMNKILKDIIVRRWNQEGFYSHYIPGWDTHGMPIEHALLKKGVNSNPNLSIAEKRENCKNFALEQIEIQKAQFARLGLITDFKTIYRTLDLSFEISQLKVFINAISQDLVYQDLKPVYWSWSSQTALADAEVEYADEKSNSIYVTFDISEGNNIVSANDKILVWTTTPWTLPSNQAIAVNPGFFYNRFEYNGKFYICAKDLLEKIQKEFGWENIKLAAEFKGEEIENIRYKHMLYDLYNPVILADYVSVESGTGLVHNASGFGNDDYLACKKYGIKPYVPIDEYGKFNSTSIDKSLIGMFYLDADEVIINKLKDNGALLKHEVITHSVAHDWRTKKPVMYRATKQWFVNIDKLKDGMLNEIDTVKFPNFLNKQQMIDTIKKRAEWCISRQRYWGVPIIIIYDENDKPIFDPKVFEKILNIFENEGTNVWYEKPATDFLPEGYDLTKKYRKETDIMDVWFDSGTSWSVLIQNKLQYPCELYLEGKDQFRGWYNSSLINSYLSYKKAPFNQLLGCGFVLDEKGNKMSKSLGNIIDPNKVCQQYGADILRLWVANSDYTQDLRIGENILKQISEIYRRIRNSLFKFILSNISDYDYQSHSNHVKFSEVDNFVLHSLSDKINRINKDFSEFNFINIVDTINNHVIELSGWYFDIIKDTLYCDDKNDIKRRGVQTVLYHIITQYLFLLAPIIPHTAEEVYSFLNIPNKQESIFLHDHKFELSDINGKVNNEKWSQFFQIKNIVYFKLEELRKEKIINKNTQAKVELTFNNNFSWTQDELRYLLNVAAVDIINKNDEKDIICKCENSNYERCERCWNYFKPGTLNEEKICHRCEDVIKKQTNN